MNESADVKLWPEMMVGVEMMLLRASPVFWGWGTPRGNGAAVILVPGFLGTDSIMTEMYEWLKRMDYRPYFSGIGVNADCPSMLIRNNLIGTLKKARKETGEKVHFIGHSLGGILARSLAAKKPKDIKSVITLASPFRGIVAHPSVLKAANIVRESIFRRHGDKVLPDCFTIGCGCEFAKRLRNFPVGVKETAVYTRGDGIVDWRYCITGNPDVDVEVPGTHIGLIFNPTVYGIIADRLHEA